MKFKGDILITDPCYVMLPDGQGVTLSKDDWTSTKWGSDLSKIGINTFITTPTGIGDKCGDVYVCDNADRTFNGLKESMNNRTTSEFLSNFGIIGKFGVDSGTISAMDYNEVKKYNPDIEKWIEEHSWCATVFRDFDGEISSRPIQITGEFSYQLYVLVGEDINNNSFIAI